MAEVKVIFYENSEFDGRRKTYHGEHAEPELKDVDYHDSGKNMDNSINSIEMGDGAYLVVYTSENYNIGRGFNYLAKLNPGESQKFLRNVYGIHNGPDAIAPVNFNNNIGSFEIFNSQPNHFLLDKTDRKDEAGCWVKMYSDKNFNGVIENVPYVSAQELTNRDGIESTPEVANFIFGSGNLRSVQYLRFTFKKGSNGASDSTVFKCQSIVTGPNTYLELYPEEEFLKADQVIKIGPNAFIINLFDLMGSNNIRSLKIFDSLPSNDWVPTKDPIISETTKAQNQQYQVATSTTSMMVGFTGLIPVPGMDIVSSISGAFLNTFWPVNPARKSVWEDLKDYSRACLGTVISEINLTIMETKIKSYEHFLTELYKLEVAIDEEREEVFDELDGQLMSDEEFFMGEKSGLSYINPEAQLTYQMVFTSLAISMKWLKAYHSDKLSLIPLSPRNQEVAEGNLTEKINEYESGMNLSITNSVEKRREYVEIVAVDGNSQKFQVIDKFNGFIYEGDGLTESEANSRMESVKEYVGNVLHQELKLYLLPFHYFKCLDPRTVTPIFEPYPYVVTIGYPNSDPTEVVHLNGQKIIGIKIAASHDKKYVASVEFALDDGTVFKAGQDNGNYTVSQTLAEGDTIINFYGRARGIIDQLHIQTNDGLDLGVGGSGGDPFYITPPMGSVNTLKSITAGVNPNNGYISYLTFIYEISIPTLDGEMCVYPPLGLPEGAISNKTQQKLH